MRWILLGAVFALLLLFPALGTVVLGLVAAAVSQPLIVAFSLGLVVGVQVRQSRRWAR